MLRNGNWFIQRTLLDIGGHVKIFFRGLKNGGKWRVFRIPGNQVYNRQKLVKAATQLFETEPGSSKCRRCMEKRRPSGTPGSSGPLGQPSQPRFERRRLSYQNQLAQKQFLAKFPKFPRKSMIFPELYRSNENRRKRQKSSKISESVKQECHITPKKRPKTSRSGWARRSFPLPA